MLKDVLKNRGISQKDFASQLNVTENTVNRWCMQDSEYINKISVNRLIIILKLLNCTINDIFDEYNSIETVFNNNQKMKEFESLITHHIEDIKENKSLNIDEIKYLADMLNGSMFKFDILSKTYLKLGITDSSVYDNLGNKWAINVSELIKKVDNLSEFHCYSLIKAIQNWWETIPEKDSNSIEFIV